MTDTHLFDHSILADAGWSGDDNQPRTVQRSQIIDELISLLIQSKIVSHQFRLNSIPVQFRVFGASSPDA
jgi:hypothetical protein